MIPLDLGPAVVYAVLRDREQWPGVELDGLEVEPRGDIALRRLPCVVPGWDRLPGPVDPSGLATDHRCGLYVSDTAGGRILRVGLDCHERAVLDGLRRPTGLCVGPFGWLFAVEQGTGRILVYSMPDLALRDVWPGLFQPTAIAAGADHVTVVEAGRDRLTRLDAWGRPDQGFNQRVSPPAGPLRPATLAVGADGTLFVADAARGGVTCLSGDGSPTGRWLAPSTEPTALAVGDGVLYVADGRTGRILMVGLPDGDDRGQVAGFRGQVSALAAAPTRALFVKTGMGEHYVVAAPDGARATTGTLLGGPFDAGEDNTWLRVAVDARTPTGTAMTLDTFTSASNTAAVAGWQRAPSSDCLVAPDRFLWVRVGLHRHGEDDPSATPVVLQVHAETPGDSYLEHLPSVYARNPGAGDFLTRFLELARSALGDLDSEISLLARRYDPATAPAAWLEVLAEWLAFPLPDGAARRPAELRTLLSELPELYRTRATPAGLRRYAEIYAGASPALFEDFTTRGIWVLDETSALGFDTGLPSTAVDGLVVGEATVGATGPVDTSTWGSTLFEDTAHAFTLVVPAAAAPKDTDRRQRLAWTVESEKPAHTDCHVCYAEPLMRVGVQARVGVDAIVAGDSPELSLDELATLNRDARLAGEDGTPMVAGGHHRLGIDTLVG